MPSLFGVLAGYQVPPQPTAAGSLTAWTVDPAMVLLVTGAAAAYLHGVARVGRSGARWPRLRSGCFVGLGLGSLVLVTMGWVGAHAHVLFWAYTLQITALLFIAPVLLALGRPLSLAGATLSPAGWRRLSRVMGSRPVSVLTSPFVGPLLAPVTLGLIFFTPWYQATLQNYLLYELLHVVLLGLGLMFALPLVGEGADLVPMSIAAGVFVGFIELLLDAIPGIVVRLKTQLIAAGYYLSVHRSWGPTRLHDQQYGGAILWFLGEALDLPFLAILIVRWIRADEREAAAIDRELDRQSVTTATSPEGTLPAVRGGPSSAARMRPWWESNPELFEDRRAQAFRRAAARRTGRAAGPTGVNRDRKQGSETECQDPPQR